MYCIRILGVLFFIYQERKNVLLKRHYNALISISMHDSHDENDDGKNRKAHCTHGQVKFKIKREKKMCVSQLKTNLDFILNDKKPALNI